MKLDFTRKTSRVKDGHQTPDPTTSYCSGVVSHKSISVALSYTALMGLDVMAADSQNDCLKSPSSEKHYVIFGPELGLDNVGKVEPIKQALYVGMVTRREFWHHLRRWIDFLDFVSCKADRNI